MRQYRPSTFHSASLFSNDDCNGPSYDGCSFDQTHPPSGLSSFSSASFTHCSFYGFESNGWGGAISFTSGNRLSVKDSIFTRCTHTVTFSDYNGGAAVFSNCGSLLSVESCVFISCSTTSIGGAVLATGECKSARICVCRCLKCLADYGGGISTHYGAVGKISSCIFTFCESTKSGGGYYHNSLHSESTALYECLFVHNAANGNAPNGGGAFEDYKSSTYVSHCSFSFFADNTALNGVGYDVCSYKLSFGTENIIHCMTTRTSLSFYDCTGYVTNWLPLGTITHM